MESVGGWLGRHSSISWIVHMVGVVLGVLWLVCFKFWELLDLIIKYYYRVRM
jgi:hypothetical protein